MADTSMMPTTNNGQPPMSLVGGGTNVQMPQSQTITVPTAILNHPAVQAGVQQAQADMAKQAATMPTGDISMGDERTQAIIKNIQAMRNSGAFAPLGAPSNHPVLGGIANAMMAFGQGVTKQPFLTDFQNNQIQRNQQMAEMARYGQLTPEQQIMMGFRQKSADLASDKFANTQSEQGQKDWSAFLKTVNPETASSRSTLGMAGNGNLRIDRALTTLNNPKIPLTPQLLSSLTTDLAAQYSGGVPTDQGMGEQQYDTIQSRIAALKQFVTSKPQNIDTPEIRQQLTDTLNSVKDINSQSIRNNLDAMEAGQDKLVGAHADAWQKYRSQIESKFARMSTDGQQAQPGTQGIAAPTGSPQAQATQANNVQKIGRFQVQVH